MHADSRGLTLVEIVVAVAIILVALTAIVTALNMYLRIVSSNANAVRAAFLAEEGIETVKLLRDTSWNTNIAPLGSGTNYYLTFGTSTWAATTTSSTIDSRFIRTFQVSSVVRDGSSNIDTSGAGGTVDTSTKLVTVSVSWSDRGATTTRSLSAYVANFYND